MLAKVQNKIDEYTEKFRSNHFEPIVRCPVYVLDSSSDQRLLDSGDSDEYVKWPDYWPSGGASGIYAFFNGDELLYIGKASRQPLANRVGSYFKHAEGRKRGVLRKPGSWSKEPTHVVMWTVPKEMYFEAAALEEYLIYELRDFLPDNVIGK
jgi:hypothetical protein